MAYDPNKATNAQNNPLNDPNWDNMTQAQRDAASAKAAADKTAARKPYGQ
jgi:hypothetical protein